MRATYIFDYLVRSSDKKRPPRRVMGVFYGMKSINRDQIESEIATYLQEKLAPDEVFFIGHKEFCDQVKSSVADGDLKHRLRGSLKGTPDTKIGYLHFSHDTMSYVLEEAGDDDANNVIDALRDNGLLQLFLRNQGLFVASANHHYIAPSGEHCDRFIRTANVLRSSSEIDFVAYWLLPYLHDTVQFIYLDTAAISAVAYALVQQKLFHSPNYVPPLIESYGSHGGIDSFLFAHPARSVAIISASTRGSLAVKLGERRIPIDRIATLYALGDDFRDTPNILCNLTKRDQSDTQRFLPVQRYDEQRCSLCDAKSKPISIIDDQLLPARPLLTPRKVKHSDAPAGLRATFNEFARSDIFRVHKRNEYGNVTHPIFVDVKALLDRHHDFPTFKKQLERTLRRAVPVQLQHIVHMKDKASEQLAMLIADRYGAVAGGATAPEIRSAETLQGKGLPATSSVLVVGACITDGRDLMDIARSLRNVQTEGTVGFVVAITRVSDRRELEDIKSSLTYGDDGSNICRLESVWDIDITNDVRHNPWDEELGTLKKLRDFLLKKKSPLPAELETRISMLEKETANGMTNNIFLPTLKTGRELRVRENFVFFDSNTSPDKVSQADIFAAISCVLHKWRSEGRTALRESISHRDVISPICFDRFNDGVIQAAMLRAAYPGELNYEDSDLLSAHIFDVIRNVFLHCGDDRGEATMEFLLALVGQKIRLSHEYRSMLHELIKSELVMQSDFVNCIYKYMVET